MYAVIRTGSKQYRVEPGHEVLIEKLPVESGQDFEITDVLLYSNGDSVSVGTPVVPVTVHCKCLGHERGPKITTIKYKRRKNYRRKLGHRQDLTRILVEKFEQKGN